MLYAENLTEGQTFQLGSYTIGEAEILEFAARRSDPHATGGTGAHLASPGMIWPPSNACGYCGKSAAELQRIFDAAGPG